MTVFNSMKYSFNNKTRVSDRANIRTNTNNWRLHMTLWGPSKDPHQDWKRCFKQLRISFWLFWDAWNPELHSSLIILFSSSFSVSLFLLSLFFGSYESRTLGTTSQHQSTPSTGLGPNCERCLRRWARMANSARSVWNFQPRWPPVGL